MEHIDYLRKKIREYNCKADTWLSIIKGEHCLSKSRMAGLSTVYEQNKQIADEYRRRLNVWNKTEEESKNYVG